MELTGKLVVKYDIQSVTDKFKKREFVIKTEGTYPQFIKMQLINDKCGLIDPVNVGDDLTAQINIGGREYVKDGVTNYFNSIEAWKIEAKRVESATHVPEPQPDLPVDDGESNDLPF